MHMMLESSILELQTDNELEYMDVPSIEQKLLKLVS